MTTLLDKEISIIGFGRMGQLLASIFKPEFKVRVVDNNHSLKTKAAEIGVVFASLDEALAASTIIYCVPISCLEETVKEHLAVFKLMTKPKLIIDVLSVKVHPKNVLQKLLPSNYDILLTHPMFGPDSVKAKGLEGRIIILDKFRISQEKFAFWKDYFIGKKLNVIEMSADEHDRLAAKSQAVTHMVGRALNKIGFEPTVIDAVGTTVLHGIKEQTCNDTWQLFNDLQTYNPYAKEMRDELASAFDNLNKQLDPKIVEDVYS